MGVTVVLPAYNEARHIGACLDSLLRQDHPELEVVVVDDGSTDGTRAIVEQVAAREPRVRLIPQQRGGASRAINQGLREARHPRVYLAEADGLYPPGFLRVIDAHPLDGGRVGALGPHFPAGQPPWTPESETTWVTRVRDNELRLYYFDSLYVPPCGRFYLREPLLEIGGFPPGVTRGYELDLARRLRARGCTFVFVPEAVWYHHEPTTFDQYARKAVADGLNEATLAGLSGPGIVPLLRAGYWLSLPAGLLLLPAVPFLGGVLLLGFAFYGAAVAWGLPLGRAWRKLRYPSHLPLNLLLWPIRGWLFTFGLFRGLLQIGRRRYQEVAVRE